MGIFLFILYIAIFIFLIIDFVLCVKGKAKWIVLFVLEIISAVLAAGLWIYYNGLHGYGFMPGLSYLGEIVLSLCALILYVIMLTVTTVTRLIFRLVRKNKNK